MWGGKGLEMVVMFLISRFNDIKEGDSKIGSGCLFVMLNQNDFRNLLSTPAPNSSGGGKGLGGDKIRFDMKQIAKWDRENNRGGGGGSRKGGDRGRGGGDSKYFNKHRLPPGMNNEEEGEDNEGQKPKYRDRARERQKDCNPDYNPGIYFFILLSYSILNVT